MPEDTHALKHAAEKQPDMAPHMAHTRETYLQRAPWAGRAREPKGNSFSACEHLKESPSVNDPAPAETGKQEKDTFTYNTEKRPLPSQTTQSLTSLFNTQEP